MQPRRKTLRFVKQRGNKYMVFCTTTPIVHNNTHILQNVRTMHFTFRKSAFYCSVTRNLCNQKQQLLLLILHTSGVGSAIAFSLMGYKPPNFEVGTKVMQSQTELRRSALQELNLSYV